MRAGTVPQWSAVLEGQELLLYEGSRVCGAGQVWWRSDTLCPLPEADETRFVAWPTSIHWYGSRM